MDVLERFAAGDLEAFEIVFRQLQSEVYGWIMRIVRDHAAAEDLTLETFWRMYRARARFDPSCSAGPWARRIATHVALDYLRRRRPEIELPENIPQPRGPDPALQRELGDQIRWAFDRLPAKLRVAATLALVEECSYEEVAAALGCTVGAVKLRVFRAVRVLRKLLENIHERRTTDSSNAEASVSAERH